MREPHEELASAIVAEGIQDYYESAKKIVELSIAYLFGENFRKISQLIRQFEDNRNMFLECRRFLLSDWYEFLSDTNGRAVKEKLDDKVRDYGNQRLLVSVASTRV